MKGLWKEKLLIKFGKFMLSKRDEAKKVIVTGLEPATSRPVILRSTIDLHDQPYYLHFQNYHISKATSDRLSYKILKIFEWDFPIYFMWYK